MKSLVTGASGFVGSAVMRELLAAGHEVRVLVRPQSDRRNLEGLSVEIVEGNLRDRASLQRIVRGCDYLFHVAADYRLWTPDPDIMYDTNVRGTQELILAAAEAGLKRIVYTSSVATLGVSEDGTLVTEETPSALHMMIGHYKRTKYLAEETVRKLTLQNQLPLVIVNPSAPIGPRDIKPTPTGRIVLDTLLGRMPAYVDTWLNVVHVDDVARGHLLAFERGKPGERYILGGENMTLLQILSTIDELTGTRKFRMRLPHKMVMLSAHILDKWALVSGREPRVTVEAARMAKKKMIYSTDKAMRELGYQYRPAREALQDAITWYKNKGYL